MMRSADDHMRAFVLKARAAPVDSHKLLAGVGEDAHSEILAHTLMNAIFVAQSHRRDVVVHLVLESTADFSRTISFDTQSLGQLGGFHEQALLSRIARALDVSLGMGKDELREVEAGISVRTLSFERLIRELSEQYRLFVMAPKGTPIRQQAFEGPCCFILTDHIPMPRNSYGILDRLGATRLSLGPTMLFASQCVVLIHHELDLR